MTLTIKHMETKQISQIAAVAFLYLCARYDSVRFQDVKGGFESRDHAVALYPQIRKGVILVRLRGLPREFAHLVDTGRLRHYPHDAYSRFEINDPADTALLLALMDRAVLLARLGDFRRRAA
ncbi:MAG: hypothetical protein ACYC7F_02255 [Gemmatimonadaceae bacterium]